MEARYLTALDSVVKRMAGASEGVATQQTALRRELAAAYRLVAQVANLGDNDCMILRNHGFLTVGET
jgi:hypothetical protein